MSLKACPIEDTLFIKESDLIVYITIEDVQVRAEERIGRRLTDEEMEEAREWITQVFDPDPILDSAIEVGPDVNEDKGGDEVVKG